MTENLKPTYQRKMNDKLPLPTKEWILSRYEELTPKNQGIFRDFLNYLLTQQNNNSWLLPATRAIKIYIESQQGAMVDSFWIDIDNLIKIHLNL